MFGIFKRRRTESAKPGIAATLLGKIMIQLSHHQRRLADFLQSKMEGLSKRGKSRLLLLFCLVAGGISLAVVSESLFGETSSVMHVTPIKRPAYVTQPGDPVNAISFISKREYERIVRFRNYMDSLSGTKNGKKIADSILVSRPGLMDSVIEIEKIYQLQQKK